MTRRLFVKILGCLAGAGLTLSAVSAETPGPSLLNWARQLYEAEVARQNDRATRQGADRDAFLALFAPDLRDLVQRPTAPASRLPDGPILSAFFGWGVLPGHRVELKAVRAARVPGRGSAEAVEIDYLLRGEPRSLAVHAVRSGESWEIEDIVYDRGESYLHFQRRRTGH